MTIKKVCWKDVKNEEKLADVRDILHEMFKNSRDGMIELEMKGGHNVRKNS